MARWLNLVAWLIVAGDVLGVGFLVGYIWAGV